MLISSRIWWNNNCRKACICGGIGKAKHQYWGKPKRWTLVSVEATFSHPVQKVLCNLSMQIQMKLVLSNKYTFKEKKNGLPECSSRCLLPDVIQEEEQRRCWERKGICWFFKPEIYFVLIYPTSAGFILYCECYCINSCILWRSTLMTGYASIEDARNGHYCYPMYTSGQLSAKGEQHQWSKWVECDLQGGCALILTG